MIEAPHSETVPKISPDGMWEWNGTQWMPTQPPPGPQQVAQSAPFAPPAPPLGTMGYPSQAPQKKKGHKVRNGLIVLGVLVVAGAIASAGSHPNTSSSSSSSSATAAPSTSASAAPSAKASAAPSTKASPVAPPAAPPAAPAAIAPIVLTGSGQQAMHFTSTQGLSVFDAKCSCSGNFIVELDDSNGKLKDIPINVIGQYQGSLGEPMSAGDQILKVTADAAWSITITQPRNASGASLPKTYTGSGQQIVGPFTADQAVGIKAHNAGSSNFIVSVIDRNGNMTDIPINEIGNYDGSTISNNLSGGPTYYLNVDSDGTWTITVSKP